MTIQIITSSYPSYSTDATGAAGLFIRDFALQLVKLGHRVVVLTAARKKQYQADPGITIEKLAWLGGDQELASVNFLNPVNWFIILHFFWNGLRITRRAAQTHHIERTLCMWIVPAGVFGWWTNKMDDIPYDAWALGSDIWKIRKLPFGSMMLRRIILNADCIFADGTQLCEDVKTISGRDCTFLSTSRKLPDADPAFPLLEPTTCKHFLFVGRYHPNKGPDILIDAVARLPKEILNRFRLHMFGFGPMKDILQEKIRAHHLQTIVGVNDVIDAQEFSNYLSRCDYLVIPSRIESIPVVLSDAAQRGVPLIVSDAGDMGDLVKGLNAGIVFPSQRSDLLAEAIATAVTTNSESYQEGVTALAGKFDVAETCKRWLANATMREGIGR